MTYNGFERDEEKALQASYPEYQKITAAEKARHDVLGKLMDSGNVSLEKDYVVAKGSKPQTVLLILGERNKDKLKTIGEEIIKGKIEFDKVTKVGEGALHYTADDRLISLVKELQKQPTAELVK